MPNYTQFLSFKNCQLWVNVHFFFNWKPSSEALKQCNIPFCMFYSLFPFLCIPWKSHGVWMPGCVQAPQNTMVFPHWGRNGWMLLAFPGAVCTQGSGLCCRTVKAKDTLCCVVSHWGRLNSVINSSYQWLGWGKVLFIGSKSRSFGMRILSSTSCFGKIIQSV